MAGTSLLALIDDIATLLDDVGVMSKVAAEKTAGVLGDDLALNAQQVTGVVAERELPVVWAVAKGSALNKAILVPAALGISAIAPWAITPLLMAGGGYLCFEGAEKLVHQYMHPGHELEEDGELVDAFENHEIDMVEFEKEKIKGAIRTDFVLSAEIIVIALGTVAEVEFLKQVGVLVTVAVLMTIGVYGLVGGIVKLDDLGFYLAKKESRVLNVIGDLLIKGTPYLMKTLSVVGTIAMFLVGGGILAHGLPGISKMGHAITEMNGLAGVFGPHLFNGVVGVLSGMLLVVLFAGFNKIRGLASRTAPK